MPQTKTRKKSLQRARLRTSLNRRRKRLAHDAVRSALDAARAGDEQELDAAVRKAQQALDRACQKGPYHGNAAARKKARMMARIGRLRGQAS